MQITLTDVGKRFEYQWPLRHVNCIIETGQILGITGHNGSGKSTLAKIMAGAITISEGNISWENDGQPLNWEKVALSTAIASPYLELPEDMTLSELVAFQGGLRNWTEGLDNSTVLKHFQLSRVEGKSISKFSSGMKQRVKIGLAILSQSDLLILDEPHANLDDQGKKWVQEMIATYRLGRTTIICSNYDPAELAPCTQQLDIRQYTAENKNHS